MREEAARSIRISWGVAILMVGLAYFIGPFWATGAMFLGTLLVLWEYFPHWFKAEYWTADRLAVAWLPVGAIGMGIALYAAAYYVPPLPLVLKHPSVPTLAMLSETYDYNKTQANPLSSNATASKPVDAKPLQLWDLFLLDFNTTLRMHPDPPQPVSKGTQPIAQAYFDFNAKSEFIGFFIPSGVTDTYGACVYLASLDHASILKNWGVKSSGGISGQMTNQDDLVFTGRVYLYHEADLSIEQRAALIQLYRTRHLDVQFRGSDHMLMQDLARKAEKKAK